VVYGRIADREALSRKYPEGFVAGGCYVRSVEDPGPDRSCRRCGRRFRSGGPAAEIWLGAVVRGGHRRKRLRQQMLVVACWVFWDGLVRELALGRQEAGDPAGQASQVLASVDDEGRADLPGVGKVVLPQGDAEADVADPVVGGGNRQLVL
jgi:hypothetical protein